MKKAIPFGYCHCGCGKKTRISPQNNTANKLVKGRPFLYLYGHHAFGNKHAAGNKVSHQRTQEAKPEPQFVEVNGEQCVRIPLTMGKWALVSRTSYPKVKDQVWLYSQGCACRVKPNGSKERMHRVIAGFPKGKVKHRNDDMLDNRDGNLRVR